MRGRKKEKEEMEEGDKEEREDGSMKQWLKEMV